MAVGLPSAQRPPAVETVVEGGHRRHRQHSCVTNEAVNCDGVTHLVKEEADRGGANRDDRYQNEFLVHSFGRRFRRCAEYSLALQ
jgi:hypothetical protein